jgi:penicillin amidase
VHRSNASGVNAYLVSHALPPEYSALRLTRIEPWTPLDSIALGKLFAFQLSFEFDVDPTIALNSYERAGGNASGFDGRALFFEDLDRSAPFDPAATIPDALKTRRRARSAFVDHHDGDCSALHPMGLQLAKQWRERLGTVPTFSSLLDRKQRGGSNEWAVSGRFTNSGLPFIASLPSQFYPMGLTVPGELEVFGSSISGIPGVVAGYNGHLAWGSTVSLFEDVLQVPARGY